MREAAEVTPVEAVLLEVKEDEVLLLDLEFHLEDQVEDLLFLVLRVHLIQVRIRLHLLLDHVVFRFSEALPKLLVEEEHQIL